MGLQDFTGNSNIGNPPNGGSSSGGPSAPSLPNLGASSDIEDMLIALTKHLQHSLAKTSLTRCLLVQRELVRQKSLKKLLAASQSAMTLYQMLQPTALSARFHSPPSLLVHLLLVNLKREWLTSSTMSRTRKTTSSSSSTKFTSS